MKPRILLPLFFGFLLVTVTNGAALRDPTEPPQGFRETPAALQATPGSSDTGEIFTDEPVVPAKRVGFVFFGHTTVALIDGIRYRVGDVYNESRILEITKSEIILVDQGGQRWVLDVQQ